MNDNTLRIAVYVVVVVIAILATLTIRRSKVQTTQHSRGKVQTARQTTLAACRFRHQEIQGKEAYRRSCNGCFKTVSKRDEADLGNLREDPPPLFEDIVSQSYQPGDEFSRLYAPQGYLFGLDRPGESHTHSLREFMQYPALHRERFLAALLAEISAPVSLKEEDYDKEGTRIYLSNPEATYRAHRPRSLGTLGVKRMDCYVTPALGVSDEDRETYKLHKLTIVHYVFATAADIAVRNSLHKGAEAAKKSARDHLRKRYREVFSEHVGLANSLMSDEVSEIIDADRALQDLKAFGSAVLGLEKAEWLPDLSSVWSGTLRQLLGYAKECESKTQVSLLIGMLPSWHQSQKRLVQTVMLIAPSVDK